jgi:pyruvate,orthophosphate dikinase
LPNEEIEIAELAELMRVEAEHLKRKVESLKEANPMLGHRGCRLGISYPEITEMQARAIFTAAAQVKREGIDVHPEIMIPLVGHVNELAKQKEIVLKVAEEVKRAYGVSIEFLVGTMIELPRAALTADKVAEQAEFFSYGTNDLTQTTFGLSRDDAGKIIASYLQEKIWEGDPFVAIDREGVGELMRIGVEKGRKTRPTLKVGICGEHGGEPSSVEFCHRLNLNYVSCSPYRVPIARLAAARASLDNQ